MKRRGWYWANKRPKGPVLVFDLESHSFGIDLGGLDWTTWVLVDPRGRLVGSGKWGI